MSKKKRKFEKNEKINFALWVRPFEVTIQTTDFFAEVVNIFF